VNQHLATGQLKNMARQAWWAFRTAKPSDRYSRILQGRVLLEVDRRKRVMVAVMMSDGSEIVTSDFSKAVAALVQ